MKYGGRVHSAQYSGMKVPTLYDNKKLRDSAKNSRRSLCLLFRLMLYTRLASAVAVCIANRGRYTQLAWLANPNPNPNPT